jgi:hypothetical protein
MTASAMGTMRPRVISTPIEQRLGIEAVIVASSLFMLLCVALIRTVSMRDKAGWKEDEIK